jgi:catechol 2,3-dioxygenase-like lactoylglutathione lyase family enzyme
MSAVTGSGWGSSAPWPANVVGEVYHVGLRVPDIHAAKEELSASLGLHWAPAQHFDMKPWVPGEGYKELELHLTESVEGPVHVELSQGTPGSIWDHNLGVGLHHFGVWVEDVGETVTTLIGQGWTVEMAALAPEEGYGHFAYVRSPSGIVFEPVSADSKEKHERWWSGGRYG